MKPRTGASSRFKATYCLLLIFERKSRMVYIENWLSQFGIFNDFGESSLKSSVSPILILLRKCSPHFCGDTFRWLVYLPNSSTTFTSTILNISSGLTLPQVGHSPTSLLICASIFLKYITDSTGLP